jgi:hypothetical protein
VNAAALQPAATHDVLRCTCAPDSTAPGEGRRLIDSWRSKLDPNALQVARLLVSELISLSLRCWVPGVDDSDLELTLKHDGVRMRIEVIRCGGCLVFPTADAETADLSLSLVDELADRWGMSRTLDATTCWLEIYC